MDRRINPEEDLEVEKQRLFGVLDQARRNIDFDIDVLQEGRSCGVAETDPLGRSLASSIQRVTGRPARLEMCPGLLEIRYYAERGIPAFAYGPGLLTVSHGPNEFVPVGRIVECAEVYAITAAQVFGSAAV